MMNNSIALHHIGKSFGGKKVLKDISLSIAEGELFGLLGPSGAGKTTLIKIMTGQLSYEGEAKVFGAEASTIGNEIFSRVGMVLDNCNVYERLSVYDNMKLFAGICGINNIEIDPVLTKVGLSAAKKTNAGKLSKGMHKRLLLARAILHKPALLFLDEPTSGLDPATTSQIHELLSELKTQGTTIFLTTHNMEEAYQLCDHVALLHQGNIVEYGAPEELCLRYNRQNVITLVTKQGETVLLPNCAESAEELCFFLKQENIQAIHSSEPDLETVFMTLTGRSLSGENTESEAAV